MSGNAVLKQIDEFDTGNLKKVETQEKVVLPDKDSIAQERTEVELRSQIEQGKDLKHVETAEKNPLPSKEDIDAEKRASQTS